MGIITNSMSGAGDKGQGYIDVSELLISNNWNLYIHSHIQDLLDLCEEKGYNMIVANAPNTSITTSSDRAYSLYAYSTQGNQFTHNAWSGLLIEAKQGSKDAYLSVVSDKIVYLIFYCKDKNSSSTKTWEMIDLAQKPLQYDFAFENGGIQSFSSYGFKNKIEYLKVTQGGTSSSVVGLIDSYSGNLTLPDTINSAKIEDFSKNGHIRACRKFYLNIANKKINNISISNSPAYGIVLYGQMCGIPSATTPIYSYSGGTIIDSSNNEYDVSLISNDKNTSWTLYVVQRSIKLTDNSTSGTFTDYEISTLQNGTKQIELNNEIYKLSSTGADSITFTSLAGKKHINIVISTKAWTLVEESPNPTCYDTNETINFTAIMAEYAADTTKSGKLRPFTSSDTLLSADSIKKIIDGNYKMFSFNAKIGENVMKAYMPISYYSEANSSNYYTFKGQVTFLNNGWNTIDVQMQFIHNSTAGTYSNNPGYGFFKFTAETAISA